MAPPIGFSPLALSEKVEQIAAFETMGGLGAVAKFGIARRRAFLVACGGSTGYPTWAA
jgi:hypothetical protein